VNEKFGGVGSPCLRYDIYDVRNGQRMSSCMLRTNPRDHTKLSIRRVRQRGSQTIEFGIVILPFLAFVMLVLDVAWIVFAQASLQYGARQGVRWGVTCRIASGQSGLDASIRQVVGQNSMGFVNSSNASSVVHIQYLNPSTLAVIPSGGPAGGNVLKVSITGLTLKSFGPIYRGSAALSHGSVSASAMSMDVMEGSSSNTCTE